MCSAKGESCLADADDGGGEIRRGPTRRILWTRDRSSSVNAVGCDLGAAAGAMGGRVLAAALRLLCEDYNSAGLPDLFLWSWGEMETGEKSLARFVEVKSERDSLSRRQRLWLATLRDAGAQAEVCHLRDEPVVMPLGTHCQVR